MRQKYKISRYGFQYNAGGNFGKTVRTTFAVPSLKLWKISDKTTRPLQACQYAITHATCRLPPGLLPDLADSENSLKYIIYFLCTELLALEPLILQNASRGTD
jgi:hypothetical protein